MVTVESICFLLVTVFSLGLFYYLGWRAGVENAMRHAMMFHVMGADNNDDE